MGKEGVLFIRLTPYHHELGAIFFCSVFPAPGTKL